jgi:sulfur carrier protein ThiS
LNGMMIPTDEILTTHLKENDEVAILVVISGG